MKQYLWAGLAVLYVCAHASDNPFDLKENLEIINQDQEVLLSELRKLAEQQANTALIEEEITPQVISDTTEEGVEDVKVDVPQESISMPEEESAVHNVVAVPETPANETEEVTSNTKPNESRSAARLDAMRERVMEQARKKYEAQQALEKAKKDEVENTETVSSAQVKEVEKLESKIAVLKEKVVEEVSPKQEEPKVEKQTETSKMTQAEIERKEVEAYEKQRLEKLAKMQAEKKAMPDKKVSSEATSIEDINLTREANEAKAAADARYEEAIKNIDLEHAAKNPEEKVAKTNKNKLEMKKEESANSKMPEKKVSSKVTSIDDINLTREANEAKAAADALYEAAIKEMSEEE